MILYPMAEALGLSESQGIWAVEGPHCPASNTSACRSYVRVNIHRKPDAEIVSRSTSSTQAYDLRTSSRAACE